MNKKLKIRDLTLRDGQQSQLATRMNQKQVDRVLPYYKNANFYAMEVWGGAVPDSTMRFLNEDPWERLESIKRSIGKNSKLTALSRGRNLFGYNPYPDEIIKGFLKNAVQSGIDIMRIFDALNDTDNMRSSIEYVKMFNGEVDCAVCYTVDPKYKLKHFLKYLKNGLGIPKKIFNVDYFLKKSMELEKMGADIITIKDIAGLIDPDTTGKLIRELKNNISKPINIHTHCTPGYGLASVLMAIMNGVDIVDTVILNFAGGPAAPAFELVQIFCDKLSIQTDVNLEEVNRINGELKNIRHEMHEYDKYKLFPVDFNIADYKLDENISKLFDMSIEYARKNNIGKLLECTQKIEKYFNFPEPDDEVRKAQIPGGMYSNMISQLKQFKLDDKLNEILEIVPDVRIDSGCPPLVTPTSQIVGVQAVNVLHG